MWRHNTDTGRVMRYSNTWQHKQTIQHDNIDHANAPQNLYRYPRYITENNNGDVVVSDWSYAVVVTSRSGRHRFDYKGPPPSGLGLDPRGVCTDALSHILVCDLNTSTVQIIDRDGQFLSYLLTKQSPGIDYKPWGLTYDAHTHRLFAGSGTWGKNKVSVYRHINRHVALTDEEEVSDTVNTSMRCRSDRD